MRDKEIITRYNINKSARVLDVGGSMKQREMIVVDTLVDIVRPEDAPYKKSGLKAKNFIKLDITKDKLPFRDKEFDFCICSHTLEDLAYPFLVIEEMGRVAERGLIITPSMGADMVFSHLDLTDWLSGARRLPGGAHHKWFFYKKHGKLRIIPKNFPILFTSKFQIVGWKGEPELIHYWQDKIEYEKGDDLNIHNLIDEYESYLVKSREKIVKGRSLFFIDSPVIVVRELIKLLLKRGEGFRYRRRF